MGQIINCPLGTIAKASEIGRRGSNRFVLIPCLDCGQPRWVTVGRAEAGRNPRCKACSIRESHKKRAPTDGLTRGKRWRLKNKDKVIAYHKQYLPKYVAAHKDQTADRLKRWYELHRASHLANTKLYRETHPEVGRTLGRRRRAREAGVLSTLTSEQWNAVKVAYKQRCAYCGKKTVLTQDHVVPISKGGTHTIDNVVPACKSCNSKKHTKILESPPVKRLLI
mgnify:CR=1 FL=1